MLSKRNDNFATKVISTENVKKNVEEVRRKNQTYFFSKLLGDKFKSYLLWKNVNFKNFDHECKQNDLFE